MKTNPTPTAKKALIKLNWAHYDKNHWINTASGMIVSKSADLQNIKPQEIKGFDFLTIKQ